MGLYICSTLFEVFDLLGISGNELNFLVIMHLFFFSETISTSCCFAMMFFGYLNVMSLKYTVEQVVSVKSTYGF